MVGAILTGAKIAGSLLSNLLAKKQQSAQAAPQTVTGPVQAESITLDPNAVRQAPAAGNMLDVVKNGLNIAGPLLGKIGAPGISAVGGLAKNILSTLNDDEWFEHYDGNGATFNELLGGRCVTGTFTNGISHYKDIRVYGAIAFYEIGLRSNGNFYNTFMPQMLAYIREKTNNVLTDDIDKYQLCVVALVKCYTILYTLKKYYRLMLDTPANAPTIISTLNSFQPGNINATKGIIDSLESFLKSTSKLPYALVSYLRWRFGTIFLSSNTKRAGFISYDPVMEWPTSVDPTTKNVTFANTGARSIHPTGSYGNGATPAQIATVVDNLRTIIIQCGRASADMALAYKNHVVSYEVEDRHFDEKEFCLRQNMANRAADNLAIHGYFTDSSSLGNYKPTSLDEVCHILMDSRIDMNAGIQAITISTDNSSSSDLNVAPFPVYGCSVAFDTAVIKGEWSNFATYLTDISWSAITNSTYVVKDKFTATVMAADVSPATLNNYKQYLDRDIECVVTTSLELHNYGSFVVKIGAVSGISDENAGGAPIFLQCGTLSYDRAQISGDNLRSIQRNAILNLVRGEYSNKRQIDVKEEAAAVVDDLTSKDIKIADQPIVAK